MNNKIIIGTLGTTFYRRYLAFFAISSFMFAMIKGSEHMQLAAIIMAQPVVLGVVIVLWIVYCYVAFRHVKQFVALREHQFLHTLVLRGRGYHLRRMVVLQVFLCIPLLGYAALLFRVSHNIFSSGLLWLSLACIIIYPSYGYYRLFLFPYAEIERNNRVFNIKFNLPFALWPLYGAILEKPLLFLLLKLCSAGILYLTGAWDSLEDYDHRWWVLGMMLSATVSGFILLDMRKMMQQYHIFYGSLPIGAFRWFIINFAGIMMLFIPEIIFLARYFNYERAMTILFSLSIFKLTYGLFLWSLTGQKGVDVERFLMKIFLATFILFLLVLFKINLWLIISVLVAYAISAEMIGRRI